MSGRGIISILPAMMILTCPNSARSESAGRTRPKHTDRAQTDETWSELLEAEDDYYELLDDYTDYQDYVTSFENAYTDYEEALEKYEIYKSQQVGKIPAAMSCSGRQPS